MPWVTLGVLAVAAAFGFVVFEKMKAVSGLPGIPAVGSVHAITVDSSTAAGVVGRVVLSPKDSLALTVYAAPPGTEWVFGANGPLSVTPSGTTATFVWSGPYDGSVVTAQAVLHKPASSGVALPPIAIYVVDVIYPVAA
jgi:hypothetical protein